MSWKLLAGELETKRARLQLCLLYQPLGQDANLLNNQRGRKGEYIYLILSCFAVQKAKLATGV
jgi:hypothetical protein